MDDDVAHAGTRLVRTFTRTLPLGGDGLLSEVGQQVVPPAEPLEPGLQVALLAVAAEAIGVADRAAAGQGLIVEGEAEVVGVRAGMSRLGLLSEPGCEQH